ncbi:UPF0481 protein At3g47200-like [Telopea speciosissima]|uniref:UPF0481 protein At3g47200-like n=1 Tax=Telopea speciosissima TaxID=54955 RepID=UPI001CC70073|nr:UPF0481 protein At3g47200-like [Telopea speciosissima]
MELIEQKLDEVLSSPTSMDYNIYRLPKSLVDEKPEAYVPHIVSIGPFHHKQQHLQHTETRKILYFHRFMNRTASLLHYVQVVEDLEERLYQCYPTDLKIERDSSFVMMMVVDGCFILDLLLQSKNYHKTTPILKWDYQVSQDLILVENQIPIFVLEELYRVFINGARGVREATATAAAATTADHDDHPITTQLYDLMLKYFVHHLLTTFLGMDYDTIYNSSRDRIENLKPEYRPKHLLDFLRFILIPNFAIQRSPAAAAAAANESNNNSKKNKKIPSATCASSSSSRLLCLLGGMVVDPPKKDNNVVVHIRCATKLKTASVKFEKNKKATSLLDIIFDENNGVLKIPTTKIHEGSEIILRNLVAYEQYIDDYSYISEYASFMNGLIDSREDVELLQDNGVIVTMLGDPSEVAQLFNNLVKDVMFHVHYTLPVRGKLEEYYNIRCHKWRASLMGNYFNTPWASISVVAAIMLLVLTFTQTIYTILSYHP